jgi:hypothetical protein
MRSRIMSVAPGTKPGPQWCPAGLTHTQKWRVQRLRTLEIKQEITEKKRDEQFNRDKPMVPTQIWREKRIAAEENKTTDETLADDRVTDVDDDLAPQKTWQERTIEEINEITDDTTSDEGSENNDDAPADMEVNMVFALPPNFVRPKLKLQNLFLVLKMLHLKSQRSLSST